MAYKDIPEELRALDKQKDPVEFIVRQALVAAGVRFDEVPEDRFDFTLPDHGIFIECKQFYTPRVGDQLKLAGDFGVILIQGVDAALAFHRLMTERTDEEEVTRRIRIDNVTLNADFFEKTRTCFNLVLDYTVVDAIPLASSSVVFDLGNQHHQAKLVTLMRKFGHDEMRDLKNIVGKVARVPSYVLMTGEDD